ncbi:MAG: DUF4129 domain-containing protein [Planctomycetota bacterium]
MLKYLLEFLSWLFAPLGALFEYLDNISPVLAWLVILFLVALLALLVFHIGRTFFVALDRRGLRTSVPLDVSEKLRDPDEIEMLAADAEQKSDFGLAARLLLLATLLRLEQTQKRKFRPGVTNREHLRRYRDTGVYEPLRRIVELIDRTWYGDAVCMPEHVVQCRESYAMICKAIKEPTSAERS